MIIKKKIINLNSKDMDREILSILGGKEWMCKLGYAVLRFTKRNRGKYALVETLNGILYIVPINETSYRLYQKVIDNFEIV